MAEDPVSESTQDPTSPPTQGAGRQEQPYEHTRQGSEICLSAIRHVNPPLFAWLSALLHTDSEEYLSRWVQAESLGEKGTMRVSLYTEGHRYSIRARPPSGDDGYLGCSVSARQPLAGEDYTRGNDLADGPFSEETWRSILADIVRYEAVPLGE